MNGYFIGWTLIALVGAWWLTGLYRLDRKPRRGGGPQGKSAHRPCGAAGPAEIGEQQLRASRQTGAGGPP